MKMPSIFIIVATEICFPLFPLIADEYVESKSPDGEFALHVRSAKTKRILHKVTWDGEKFVEQRAAAPN
jgi:hypothetical protein